MLHVWLHKHPRNYEYYVDDDFRELQEAAWFNDERIAEIIRVIDKNEVIIDVPYDSHKPDYVNYRILSETLGQLTPDQLSSGCKTLILTLKNPENVYSSERMGDNCLELLEKLSESLELTLCADTSYFFNGRVHILNDDSYTNNRMEYMWKYNGVDKHVVTS